jgi:hypothetical protein
LTKPKKSALLGVIVNKILSLLILFACVVARGQEIIVPTNINYVQMICTVTETISVQGNSTTADNTVTVPSPKKYSLTTKSLLAMLASYEWQAGNYESSNFPSGSKLVFFYDQSGAASNYFAVEDKAGNQLVDVSDLLTCTSQDANQLTSGKSSINSGEFPWNADFIGLFTFDDTSKGGGEQIPLSGLVKFSITDTQSKLSSITVLVKDKVSLSLTHGVGSGYWNQTNCIVQGELEASGHASWTEVEPIFTPQGNGEPPWGEPGGFTITTSPVP